MTQWSRRQFLKEIGQGSAAAPLALSLTLPAAEAPCPDECPFGTEFPLNGAWLFRLDPELRGEADGWYKLQPRPDVWEKISVPHTWQLSADAASYQGVAWYHKDFNAPAAWRGTAVRVEFEAVFHSAKVWLNGEPIGQHLRKGYTAFSLDAGQALEPGEVNRLAVRVDNSFDESMLPRGRSYDWTPDGGIIRPVSLVVGPEVFIQRVDIDAEPELDANRARLGIRVLVRNSGRDAKQVGISYEILEEGSNLSILQKPQIAGASLEPGRATDISLPEAFLPNPRLWHFDHPHLYELVTILELGAKPVHRYSTRFGVRKIEIRGTAFYLNGEPVRLMGVERMAGSHPDFGMAEPESWIRHDHDDLKNLNCVFTRVHWPQDRRVLDYCDRHGILIQEEVPAWGPHTFAGPGPEPSPEILQNGLEQLREIIHRDRNHPCIFAWGLCNEIDGQNPPAFKFAEALFNEAKKLDHRRLRTYASNSLYTTDPRGMQISKDAAGLMDFVEWNEYYESWKKGGVEVMKKNLEEIHRAFPQKPIVISEYGYCECTPERLGGDAKRAEILRSHDHAYREFDYVAGAIFFCYNDYRTHIGDKGIGVMKQRVHGVVDVFGNRKPSYEALRRESSPLEWVEVRKEGSSIVADITSRSTLPAYPLEGYTVRWVVHGFDDLPMRKTEVVLPRLTPGQRAQVQVAVREPNPTRVVVDVLRPTGFSVWTAEWRPT